MALVSGVWKQYALTKRGERRGGAQTEKIRQVLDQTWILTCQVSAQI